jgi:hypothetical protein
VTYVASLGAIPTPMHGTIAAGTYVATAFVSYNGGPIPTESSTIVVTVAGFVATIQEIDSDSPENPATDSTSTSTLNFSGGQAVYEYTCLNPNPAPAVPLNAPLGLDYTATATTLVLINSDGVGDGITITYTKIR